jgi:hypothetical protein
MLQHSQSATRIFGVVARAAPRVVLIRRGPSKQVLLLTWDTVNHQFHAGQWFKGRIYEERCDLSPSGEKFVYLAANEKPPLHSWTAVSRPPYLTALCLWKNLGTWGGGGLFESERLIQLNKMGGMNPEEGFRMPKDVRAVPIAPWAGGGEDDPIASMRMKRDGWVLADRGTRTEYKHGSKYSWEFVQPERWRKTCGKATLERRLLGIGELNGPWYAREHGLYDPDGNLVLDLGRSDWADWSRSGELLFAREGRGYRVPIDRNGKPGDIDELIDLRSLRFEQVPPPPAALTWNERVTGRRIT